MIDNELQVRLLHAAKTKDQWKAVTSYPKKGEVCLEAINTSGATAFKIKIGDGTRPYCRNTGTTQEPVWDFTSEYVLPYFGNVISASGDLQVAGYYTYPNDYETVSLRNVTVIRFYQLSLTTTAGETTLSIDSDNYKEIRAGNKLNITHTSGDNYGKINHDGITTVISDNSSVVDEKDSDVITSLTTDGYGHITAYSKDKSSNMLAADLKGAVEQTDADKTWRYRVTGDTINIKEDTASLNKLDGNTIVWNQLVRNGDFDDGVDGWVAESGTTLSVSDKTLTVNTTVSRNGIVKSLAPQIISEHKYCFMFTYKAEHPFYARYGGEGYEDISYPQSNSWSQVAFISVAITKKTFAFFTNESYAENSIQLRNVQLIDLTQMFGAGNEPSTVAEFEKLFPLPYYAYNTGQLLNVNVNGLKTVGFNLYNNGIANVISGEIYYVDGTYTSLTYDDGTSITLSDKKFTASKTGVITVTDGGADTIINLSDTSRNGTYESYWSDTTSVPITGITGISSATSLREVIFPDGFKSAGNVKDSIEGNTAYKRLDIRDYESGDESDSSVITDGTHTIKALSPIITYTRLQYPDGRPFTLPINYRVDDLGTEEWLPEQTASAPIGYPVSTITYKSNFKDAVLDTIDKVNNYKNPVQGESGNEPQTVGKVVIYDTDHSTVSSDYSVIDSESSIDPDDTSNDTIIPTVDKIVDYVEDNTVQEITTSDTGTSGLDVTQTNSSWDVSHQTVKQSSTDDGASIESEAVVELVTGVNVDRYGHVTGKHTISSDKIIAADIKAPVTKTDNSTWNFRETGGEDITIGEDTAKISKLRGNTIVWNQLVRNGNFENTSNWDAQRVSFTVNNNEASITYDGVSTDGSLRQITPITQGHKYYVSISAKSSNEQSSNVLIYDGTSTIREMPSLSEIFTKCAWIITAANTLNSGQLQICRKFSVSSGTVVVKNVNFIDLTKMFGEGNEPATVEEFEKLFPNSYYPYCEGRLVNLGGYGVKWNQLYDTTVPTAETGHKYYLSEVVSSTKTSSISTTISYTSGSTNRMCIDLTMMFGPGSEPTLEEFEAMFPDDYYEYNAGTEMNIFDAIGDKKLELESTGFNQWDEQWGTGRINTIDGTTIQPYLEGIYSLNFISVIGNKKYYFRYPYNESNIIVLEYDANKTYLGYGVVTNKEYPLRPETRFIKFYTTTSDTYKGICINISSSRNGEYEPYKKDTLDLDWIREIEYTPDGSSTPEKLFPYGLLSAGSVHDEVTETKAIKRVGVVDLGSLEWRLGSSYFYSKIGTEQTNYNYAGVCSKYRQSSDVITDKTWYNGIYQGGGQNILIVDFSYSDVPTFKSAVTGVLFYYELATPVEIPLAETHRMSYLVDDHGTEQQLPINVSSVINAPFVGTFQYLSNFKDTVLDIIDKINGYKNPVKSKDNVSQTVGKFATYDTSYTVHSSEYQVKNNPFEGAETAITLPTAEQIIEYVNTQIASSLTYKGVVSGLTGSTSGKIYFSGISNPSSGDLYFLGNLDDSETSMVVDSTDSSTYHIAEGTYYPGTMFIWNADTVGSEHWDAIAGTTTVSDGNPTLWVDEGTPVPDNRTKYTVGSIEGHDLHVTVPEIEEIAGKKAAGQVLVGNGTGKNDNTATWRGLKLDETVDNSSIPAKISTLGTGVLERYDNGSGDNHDYQWRFIEGNFDANQKLENSQFKIPDNTTVSSVPHIYKSENIELNVVKNSSNDNVGFSTYVPLLSKSNYNAVIGTVLVGNYDINSRTHDALPSWRNLKLDELSCDGTNLVPSLGTGFLKREGSDSWSITNNLLTWKLSPDPFNLTVTTLTTDNTGLLNKIYNYTGVTTIQQLSHTNGSNTVIDGFRVNVPLITDPLANPGKVLTGNYPSLPSWQNVSMENISEILSQTAGNKGYLKRTATNSGTEQEPNWTYGWELDPYGGGSLKPSYADNTAVEASEDRQTAPSAPNAGLREQTGTSTYKHYKVPFSAIENDPSTGNNAVVIILNGNFS